MIMAVTERMAQLVKDLEGINAEADRNMREFVAGTRDYDTWIDVQSQVRGQRAAAQEAIWDEARAEWARMDGLRDAAERYAC